VHFLRRLAVCWPGVQSARDNHALACNFGKYSPINVTSWALYVGAVRVQRVFARRRVPRSVQLTVDLQVRTAANQQLKREKKTEKLKIKNGCAQNYR